MTRGTASKARADFGDPAFYRLLRESRKEGIPVILADQCYGLLPEMIRVNSQTKIVLETPGDGFSIRAIAGDLRLSQEQAGFLAELSAAPASRRAVIQSPVYPRPILMNIPEIEFPPPLTEEEKQSRRTDTEDLLEGEWIPCSAPPPKPEQKKKPQNQRQPRERTREQENYLNVCACNPWRPVTQHDSEMEIPRSRGSRIRQELKDAGLLGEHDILTGKRGGKSKLAIPTQAGYEYLDRKKISYPPLRGNGSGQHKFWQHKIAEFLRKNGWGAEIEMVLNSGDGKQVDVGAVRTRNFMGEDRQEFVAYEVVWDDDLGKEISILQKDAAEGWNEIYFCVLNDEIRGKLNEKISHVFSDACNARVSFRFLKEFL
ncbi:MAG: hypothetical protein HY651_03835 [Acidobacteria bacterium]|nr:hypothetical protein [Acidobacteriota bacterium]